MNGKGYVDCCIAFTLSEYLGGWGLNQSEVSIQVTWSVSTNQRSVLRSRDHSRPIRALWISGWMLMRSECGEETLRQIQDWWISLQPLLRRNQGTFKGLNTETLILLDESFWLRQELKESQCESVRTSGWSLSWALNLHLTWVSLRSLLLGQTEPKILRLVCLCL